jgi:hypothetical protein
MVLSEAGELKLNFKPSLNKFKNLVLLLSIAFISSCGGPSGDGTLTDGVEALEHRVFLTSAKYNGEMTAPGGLEGLAAADAICKSLAELANLTRNYKAILSSTAETAKDRLTITGTIFTVSGSEKVKIASGAASFWNAELTSLLNPIQRDQNGIYISTSNSVWSGTLSTGGLDTFNCGDWKSSSANGSVGEEGADNRDWLETTTDEPCINTNRFYCISQ